MQSSGRTYRYSKLGLDEIRILVLAPGLANDPLCGSLEHARLNSKPVYRSISYAWGPPDFTHEIHFPSGVLNISSSLFGALRRFRLPYQSIRLWADAVCIDQHDTAEKNVQVAMMSQIYRDAQEVLVWLGEAAKTDTLAIIMLLYLQRLNAPSTCVDLGQISPDINIDVERFESAFLADAQRWYGSVPCPCCGEFAEVPENDFDKLEATFSAVFSLLTRPWFSRLWVLQEVAVASKVVFYCGRHHVPIQVIIAGGHIASRIADVCEADWAEFLLESDEFDCFDALYRIIAKIELTGTGEDLTSALEVTRWLTASEPRDRIYAVLALLDVEPRVKLALKPDYTIELAKLWAVVAACCFEDGGRDGVLRPTEMLAIAALSPPTSDDITLPSWAADLRALAEDHRLEWARKCNFITSYIDKVAASGTKVRKLLYNPEHWKVLSVQGLAVATVTLTLADSHFPVHLDEGDDRIITDDIVVEHAETAVFPWYIRCRRYAHDGRQGAEHVNQDFGHFLTRGMDCSQDFSGQSFILHNERLQQCADDAAVAFPGEIDAAQMYDDMRIFLGPDVASWDIDLNQVLAKTEKGHLAWVPSNSKPGDIICIFSGVKIPFVLRAVSGESFEVIGDAYVQGMMHGEAWPENESDLGYFHLV